MSYCYNTTKSKYNGKTKHIWVWENGDFYSDGHTIAINPNYYRTWNGILSFITSTLRPSFGAVRTLIHLETKEPVHSFDALESNGKYVAVGAERLKQVKFSYRTLAEKQNVNGPNQSRQYYTNTVSNQPSSSGMLTRGRKTILFVMTNGKTQEMPCKVVLTESDIDNWDMILNYIARSLDIPEGIQYLHTIYGDPILNPREIQNGCIYVAVPRNDRFVNIDYIRIFRSLLPMREIDFKKVEGLSGAPPSIYDPIIPRTPPSIEVGKSKSEGVTSIRSTLKSGPCIRKPLQTKTIAIATQPIQEKTRPKVICYEKSVFREDVTPFVVTLLYEIIERVFYVADTRADQKPNKRVSQQSDLKEIKIVTMVDVNTDNVSEYVEPTLGDNRDKESSVSGTNQSDKHESKMRATSVPLPIIEEDPSISTGFCDDLNTEYDDDDDDELVLSDNTARSISEIKLSIARITQNQYGDDQHIPCEYRETVQYKAANVEDNVREFTTAAVQEIPVAKTPLKSSSYCRCFTEESRGSEGSYKHKDKPIDKVQYIIEQSEPTKDIGENAEIIPCPIQTKQFQSKPKNKGTEQKVKPTKSSFCSKALTQESLVSENSNQYKDKFIDKAQYITAPPASTKYIPENVNVIPCPIKIGPFESQRENERTEKKVLPLESSSSYRPRSKQSLSLGSTRSQDKSINEAQFIIEPCPVKMRQPESQLENEGIENNVLPSLSEASHVSEYSSQYNEKHSDKVQSIIALQAPTKDISRNEKIIPFPIKIKQLESEPKNKDIEDRVSLFDSCSGCRTSTEGSFLSVCSNKSKNKSIDKYQFPVEPPAKDIPENAIEIQCSVKLKDSKSQPENEDAEIKILPDSSSYCRSLSEESRVLEHSSQYKDKSTGKVQSVIKPQAARKDIFENAKILPGSQKQNSERMPQIFDSKSITSSVVTTSTVKGYNSSSSTPISYMENQASCSKSYSSSDRSDDLLKNFNVSRSDQDAVEYCFPSYCGFKRNYNSNRVELLQTPREFIDDIINSSIVIIDKVTLKPQELRKYSEESQTIKKDDVKIKEKFDCCNEQLPPVKETEEMREARLKSIHENFEMGKKSVMGQPSKNTQPKETSSNLHPPILSEQTVTSATSAAKDHSEVLEEPSTTKSITFRGSDFERQVSKTGSKPSSSINSKLSSRTNTSIGSNPSSSTAKNTSGTLKQPSLTKSTTSKNLNSNTSSVRGKGGVNMGSCNNISKKNSVSESASQASNSKEIISNISQELFQKNWESDDHSVIQPDSNYQSLSSREDISMTFSKLFEDMTLSECCRKVAKRFEIYLKSLKNIHYTNRCEELDPPCADRVIATQHGERNKEIVHGSRKQDTFPKKVIPSPGEPKDLGHLTIVKDPYVCEHFSQMISLKHLPPPGEVSDQVEININVQKSSKATFHDYVPYNPYDQLNASSYFIQDVNITPTLHSLESSNLSEDIIPSNYVPCHFKRYFPIQNTQFNTTYYDSYLSHCPIHRRTQGSRSILLQPREKNSNKNDCSYSNESCACASSKDLLSKDGVKEPIIDPPEKWENQYYQTGNEDVSVVTVMKVCNRIRQPDGLHRSPSASVNTFYTADSNETEDYRDTTPDCLCREPLYNYCITCDMKENTGTQTTQLRFNTCNRDLNRQQGQCHSSKTGASKTKPSDPNLVPQTTLEGMVVVDNEYSLEDYIQTVNNEKGNC